MDRISGRLDPERIELAEVALSGVNALLTSLKIVKVQTTHRLRFTGSCSRSEFDSRCAEHDYWYHSFYFDNGYQQRGDYDVGHNVGDYGLPESMSGLSVLDVGTGSGWFATYFEQLGARVTAVDVRGYCDFDVIGRSPPYLPVETEKPWPDRILPEGRKIYYSPVSKGFWIMKDLLGLKADYVNANAYDIRPDLFGGQRFDLVFMSAVLMHLRDPIGALAALRTVCKGRLIATSYIEDQQTDAPMMRFSGGDTVTWWIPNWSGLIAWFRAAGFARASIDGKVTLTVDKPYVSPDGTCSAVNQMLALVNAYV